MVMAQLLVRNVDDDLVRRFKMRAVAAGRSAEAEHRLILEQALRPDVEAFKERARQLRERTKGRCTVEALGADPRLTATATMRRRTMTKTIDAAW